MITRKLTAGKPTTVIDVDREVDATFEREVPNGAQFSVRLRTGSPRLWPDSLCFISLQVRARLEDEYGNVVRCKKWSLEPKDPAALKVVPLGLSSGQAEQKFYAVTTAILGAPSMQQLKLTAKEVTGLDKGQTVSGDIAPLKVMPSKVLVDTVEVSRVTTEEDDRTDAGSDSGASNGTEAASLRLRPLEDGLTLHAQQVACFPM